MRKDVYSAVIVGFAHVHINRVAEKFAVDPRFSLRNCADIEPIIPELRSAPYTRVWNIDNCSKKFGMKIWDDWREMLDSVQPDLCIVNSENAHHVEITVECAKRGIGVCIEKPMATSLSDALKMYRASLTYNSLLMVNWPSAWNAGLHTAKRLIDSGAIGKMIEIKTRMGHTGPFGWAKARHGDIGMTDAEMASTWWYQNRAGGGAMVDYCCYGSLIARWFVGAPAVAAMGMRINSKMALGDAEDNAIMMVRFPDMYAVIEGTWTTQHHTFQSPIIYGDMGSLVASYSTGEVTLYRADGQREDIRNDELPPNMQDVTTAYVHYMDTGEPLHELLCAKQNLDVHAMLDAGIRSASSNKVELVNNTHWQIG
ncbi:MAG: Gfo/Idh/MocA family oxidoreductase [Oscillospiraceae bacterium]|nr:Gfo/Idh/MocA family oxidoreductase [Oscillospiraceae bacterium]